MAKQTKATQWRNNATQNDIDKLYDDFCSIKNEQEFRNLYPFSRSTARNFLRDLMPEKFTNAKKGDELMRKISIYEIMMEYNKGASPISIRIANDTKQKLENFIKDAENVEELQSLKKGTLTSLVISKGIEALENDYFDDNDGGEE